MQKVVSAWKAIGVIRLKSKYVTREVLDEMYKLYVRPHFDYDIIYHTYDPHMVLDFTHRNLRLLNKLLRFLLVAHGVKQTDKNCMRNLVGSIYTTECGTEG